MAAKLIGDHLKIIFSFIGLLLILVNNPIIFY